MRHPIKKAQRKQVNSNLTTLSFVALGIVFGDIGTSPLYTLKTIITLSGGPPSPETLLGLLSLVLWALFIVVSVKYVSFVMRASNDGEGGILALLSLLYTKENPRPIIVALGLFGAALIYGDGVITPSISVLSAIEGVNMATPFLSHLILPTAVFILFLLFVVQKQGTARIGWIFGPVMALWFLVIGVLGLWGILKFPGVLKALNPFLGVEYLFHSGMTGFSVLGGVFLSVTGAEALYADMGPVGARPIRIAWYALVLPSLLLNYSGQTALMLSGEPPDENVFYQLCPQSLLIPLIVLATLATIIASQAIITGAFAMTQQAILLGWFPPVRITQTSSTGRGQIYIKTVSGLMMIATIALTVFFKNSDNLAAAYGIAVSLTMLITTLLLFVAMRRVWEWSIPVSIGVAGGFFIMDTTFFAANFLKVFEGGWIPLGLAAGIFTVMGTWHRGSRLTTAFLTSLTQPVIDFMNSVTEQGIARVPGTAVFLTRTTNETPPTMIWHVKNNKALHQKLLVVTIKTQVVPWIDPEHRIAVRKLAPCLWRIIAHYGFMEQPDLPSVLQKAYKLGCEVDLDNVTYYVGHETIVERTDGKGMPHWQARLYAIMQRNTSHVSEYFSLPRDKVVEIGRRIEI